MTEITRCNRIGFHYNGFLNVLDNSNPAYNAKSSIKIFKKIYFCSNCGTWVSNRNLRAGRFELEFLVVFCRPVIFYCQPGHYKKYA